MKMCVHINNQYQIAHINSDHDVLFHHSFKKKMNSHRRCGLFSLAFDFISTQAIITTIAVDII